MEASPLCRCLLLIYAEIFFAFSLIPATLFPKPKQSNKQTNNNNVLSNTSIKKINYCRRWIIAAPSVGIEAQIRYNNKPQENFIVWFLCFFCDNSTYTERPQLRVDQILKMLASKLNQTQLTVLKNSWPVPFQRCSLIGPFFLKESVSLQECTEPIATQVTWHIFQSDSVVGPFCFASVSLAKKYISGLTLEVDEVDSFSFWYGKNKTQVEFT